MKHTAARAWVKDLDQGRVAALITAASDVTLVIPGNGSGTIRDIAFGNPELAREIDQAWIGRKWPDTVTPESRPKIEALLRDAANDAPPRWFQVNHPSTSGGDLPIVYTAMRVGRKDEVVAIGRSVRPIAALQQRLLETQQLVEREYAHLRQAETRHRLLFQVSAEAIVIAEASARRVLEANPAAVALLGRSAPELEGSDLLQCVDPASSTALDTLLATVRVTGRMESLKSTHRGAPITLTVSLFREGAASYFLVRMAPLAGTREATPRRQSRVLEVVAGGPDGFVVTSDRSGRIVYANRAFLDMAQLATEELAMNELLDRWLGRPGVDFGLLAAHLREHGSIRQFATTLRGEHGSSTDVEISGVSVPDGDEPFLGFTIRDVSRQPRLKDATPERPHSVEQIAQLVGRVPLKDLVRESSDVIERMCIEAALELTRDNRASAAEVLGLSRQGLYAKLRRYGIGDLDRSADGDPAAER